MRSRIPFVSASLAGLLFSAGALWAQEPVRYEARFEGADHHEARITAVFSGLAAGELELVMSRSSPGRYALHEFAKNVYEERAGDGSMRVVGVADLDHAH